ncbi:MAG: hypothetical protein ACE5RJ_01105 [Nitrosopumilaceae archaeon]
MTLLKPNQNSTKELAKIKKLSELVEKKLSQLDKKDQQKIDSLSIEELQDLNQILQLADYILCKYENKKEVHSILKDFVGIITKSTHSIEDIDDEINELVISAEGTIQRIKDLQTNVSDNYSIQNKANSKSPDSKEEPQETSANNLTNSSTPAYTQGYLQTSRVEAEQVI